MLDRLMNTETEYIKKFTSFEDLGEIIRFSDDRIPDMYTHNFTYFKDKMCDTRLIEAINKELQKRKTEGATFLRIEMNFDFNLDILKDLLGAPQIAKYDYMYIETEKGMEITGKGMQITGNRDCTISKAISEEVFFDGMQADIKANEAVMGAEFSRKRIARKLEVYRQNINSLGFYVCYSDGHPIGKCELFISGSIAKLEDFDIIEQYQRRGYGTSVIKHLLEEAGNYGAELLYLITNSDDTAKEMYKKCGLIKAGEKIELFFGLEV